MYKNYSGVSGFRLAELLGHGLRWMFDQAAHAAHEVEAMQERARSRRDLASMPDHILKDIGLSRAQAQAESEKPFWKK